MAATFGGFPCVDPLALRAWCAERNVPHDRWSAKANTFATGPGPRPGKGWVLLKKSALDALGGAADRDLVFSGTDAAHILTIKSLTPVARECVTPGAEADSGSVYLLEVADRRHHLARKPTDRAFNVTKADGSASFANTLNSGAAWTWQQAVDALAGDAGLTTPLTLPFTPDGAPANLVYWGHPSALEALCDLLDRLACALCYDPTTDAFSVVRLGSSATSNLATVDAAAGGYRLWDGYSSQYDRAAVPETVRVRFLRRPVDRTTGATPYYAVDVATGIANAVAGTKVQIDDDATAKGATGTPSNSAALATRAAERAADWVRKQRYYDGPTLRAWRDFIPTAAGLGGNAVRRVVFDDRAQLQTWAEGGNGTEIEDWRPLGGWPVWWPLNAPSGTTPSGAESCGWTAGAGSGTCIRMTIVSAQGKCSGIDTSQSIALTWDAGNADFRSGASDFTGTGSGGTGQVIYKPSNGTATIDNVSGQSKGCSGDGGELFAFGGGVLCGDTEETCANFFVVRFDCECCSIANWNGVGWYCIDGVAVYLTEDDRCNSELTLEAGGPYVDEATAQAACTPSAPCQSKDFSTGTLTVTFQNKTGDCTCLAVATVTNKGTDQADVSTASCPGNVSYQLRCSGGQYVLTVGGGITATLQSFTSSPFDLVFLLTGYGANCGGSGGTAQMRFQWTP